MASVTLEMTIGNAEAINALASVAKTLRGLQEEMPQRDDIKKACELFLFACEHLTAQRSHRP